VSWPSCDKHHKSIVTRRPSSGEQSRFTATYWEFSVRVECGAMGKLIEQNTPVTNGLFSSNHWKASSTASASLFNCVLVWSLWSGACFFTSYSMHWLTLQKWLRVSTQHPALVTQKRCASEPHGSEAQHFWAIWLRSACPRSAWLCVPGRSSQMWLISTWWPRICMTQNMVMNFFSQRLQGLGTQNYK